MIFGGVVCAGDVVDVFLHALPDGFIDGLAAGVFFDGVVAVFSVLVVGERRAVFFLFGTGIADEHEFVGDEFLAAEFVDGGDELELGEIAGSAEDYDCAGDWVGHGWSLTLGGGEGKICNRVISIC